MAAYATCLFPGWGRMCLSGSDRCLPLFTALSGMRRARPPDPGGVGGLSSAAVFWADVEACCKCAVAVLAVARSFLGLGQRIRQGGQQMGVNREQPIGSCDLQDMKHGGRLDDQPQFCVSLCGVLVG